MSGPVDDLVASAVEVEVDEADSFVHKPESELIDDYLVGLVNREPGLATCFPVLDNVIWGRNPGLHVIAAATSGGKSTLCWQEANQLAEANEVPVLFFSYEQSADELRGKAMARLSNCRNDRLKGAYQKGQLNEALERYSKFGQWIKIIEADNRHTCSVIRSMALDEKAQHGKPPVVYIDYLQQMPSDDSVSRDKRHEVDSIVSDLRRIARDVGSPVVVISSMPRSDYLRCRVSSFKESGGIEFGADTAAILGCVSEINENERDMVLSIVKNRNGRRGKIPFRYYTSMDKFEEQGGDVQPLTYLESLGGDQPE